MTVEEEQRDRYVQFKVSPAEYDTLARIAKIIFENGKIRANTVTGSAKACLFTKISEYHQGQGSKENAYKSESSSNWMLLADATQR